MGRKDEPVTIPQWICEAVQGEKTPPGINMRYSAMLCVYSNYYMR